MIRANLSQRCERILEMLLNEGDVLDLESLSGSLGISKRSIYYDIYKINDFLEELGVEGLAVERGKGISILPENRQLVKELLKGDSGGQQYVFLPSERLKIIYCYLIQSCDPLYIQDFQDKCQISRNTVFSDLKTLDAVLQTYDLKVGYSSREGYFIQGDVLKARSLFFMFFGEIRYLYENKILQFSGQEAGHLKQLELIEQELKQVYVEGNLVALAILIPGLTKGQNTFILDFPNLEEIRLKKEFTLVTKYFPDLDLDNQLYLTVHLLGSRVSQANLNIFPEEVNPEIYRLTKNFVNEFERIACLGFDNKDDLKRALFLHISSSIYRYRFGIQMDSALSNEIIKAYNDIFQLTKGAVRYLEKSLGLPIPDSEVALLAIHFGAHLRTSEEENALRILIICVNGIATSNMLKREVAQLLPKAIIKNVFYHKELDLQFSDYDLVIASIKMEISKPLILVRPILTATDRQKILNHPLVQKSLTPSVGPEKNIDKDRGLTSFLTSSCIQVFKQAWEWEEAIKTAGAPLVSQGQVTPGYLEKIILQTKDKGNYMIVTDGIFLAHARPEDGVNQLGIALAVYQNPVDFSGDMVQQVWVLAAENQESHLQILKDLFEVMRDEDLVKNILSAPDAEAVQKLIRAKVQ